MNSINSRENIEVRNEKYFKEYLNLSKKEFFNKLAKAGKPKGFGDGKWSTSNPTAGRCGSVINALRLANKIPINYIPCGQNEKTGGSHFYMINPSTMEVIDPTVYQMDKEYNYKDYHTRFLPQLSKNVKDTLAALELNIDKNKFKIKKSKNGTELITKSKKINNDTV